MRSHRARARWGAAAFARARLTVEQLTNCYFAYAFARLTPKDVLK